MGKIISIINQKGGVGKTTTAVNLAAFLSNAGKKVLLVDSDSQGNATSGLLIEKKKKKYDLYDVITNDCQIEDSILKHDLKNLSL